MSFDYYVWAWEPRWKRFHWIKYAVVYLWPHLAIFLKDILARWGFISYFMYMCQICRCLSFTYLILFLWRVLCSTFIQRENRFPIKKRVGWWPMPCKGTQFNVFVRLYIQPSEIYVFYLLVCRAKGSFMEGYKCNGCFKWDPSALRAAKEVLHFSEDSELGCSKYALA